MVPEQCQEVRDVYQESRPDGVSASREATLSRQQCGKRAPGAETRVARLGGAGRAPSASLSPALHESLDCPYKYRTELCGLSDVWQALLPAYPGPASPVDLPYRALEGLRTTHVPRQSAQAHRASRLD